MKKLLAIILTFTLVGSVLTGCGNKKTSNDDKVDNQAENVEQPREVAKVSYHKAAESFAGGSGTKEDPFQISEVGHLVLLNDMLKTEAEEINFDKTYVEGHFILTADIVMNDTADFTNWSTAAPEYGWEPIGVVGVYFGGVLDGNGHKISGVFMDADGVQTETSPDYYGLFSKLEGTIKNLTVEQSYLRVSGSASHVGTIAGGTLDAVIENCSTDTNIELYTVNTAGGITGSGGEINGCSFTGTITQLNDSFIHIGGISGDGGTVSDCTFSGTLSGKGYAGGIVGYGGNVKNSVNKGTVSGDTVGGISGRVYAAGTNQEIENPQRTIENCTNEGQVTGVTLAGGIVGWMGNDESDISMSVVGCDNKGSVNCDESVAGIIGKLSVERSGIIKIQNCTNHTDISGKGKTGGVVGEVTGAVLHQEGDVVISGCKNVGNIISEDMYSAGIITSLMVMGDEIDFDLKVENCSNEGEVQSTKYAGGILGFSNVGFNAEVSAEEMKISDDTHVSLQDCNNSGNIITKNSNSMAGGIVGVFGLGYIPTDIKNCVNTGTVKIEFTLTDEQIKESQGANWTEFYQIGGGIVGRIGDALKLTTAEGVETSADNVNAKKANIKISGCSSTGTISASDYSYILNQWDKPLYVNYLGGIIGQCSATEGYAFSVENCTYSNVERGLGISDYSDVGTKK